MTRCTCTEAVKLLLEYVDGLLAKDEQTSLDEHFAQCPPCLQFLRSYKDLPRRVREMTSTEMPKEVADRLRSFLAQRCK